MPVKAMHLCTHEGHDYSNQADSCPKLKCFHAVILIVCLH